MNEALTWPQAAVLMFNTLTMTIIVMFFFYGVFRIVMEMLREE